MGRRLILDTNVLIAYERGTIDRAALDADELAVAAVSIAEYRVGIKLADTAVRAAHQALESASGSWRTRRRFWEGTWARLALAAAAARSWVRPGVRRSRHGAPQSSATSRRSDDQASTDHRPDAARKR